MCKLWKQTCFSMFPILKPTFGSQLEPLDVMPYQLAIIAHLGLMARVYCLCKPNPAGTWVQLWHDGAGGIGRYTTCMATDVWYSLTTRKCRFYWTLHPSPKLARWGLALQELDLQIQHQPGKHNANADALSRFPLGVQLWIPGHKMLWQQ